MANVSASLHPAAVGCYDRVSPVGQPAIQSNGVGCDTFGTRYPIDRRSAGMCILENAQ